MSLPLPWIDRIFEKLTVTYGASFLHRWRDVDIGDVKSDWAHELAGFDRTPWAIAFALANLPESAPTVVTFRAICRQAPAPQEAPALPPPKADPARVAAELAKLAPMREVRPSSAMNRCGWARRIIARVEGGEKVAPLVERMAREALAANGGAA